MTEMLAFFALFAQHAGPMLAIVGLWVSVEALWRMTLYLHRKTGAELSPITRALLRMVEIDDEVTQGTRHLRDCRRDANVAKAEEEDSDHLLPGWMRVAVRHGWPALVVWGVVCAFVLLGA